jgi:hypothetical protein
MEKETKMEVDYGRILGEKQRWSLSPYHTATAKVGATAPKPAAVGALYRAPAAFYNRIGR